MSYRKFSKCALIFVAASSLLLNCSKKKEEDPEPVPVVVPPVEMRTSTYQLEAKTLGKFGTAIFTEKSGGQTIVDLSINNVTSGSYPAHIHKNSAAETGDIVHPLSNVDSQGKSTTIINVPFSDLINFDGYINVHDGTGLLSQGDIGGNILTGDKMEYNILEANSSGVGSGKVLLQKRKNGFTLATITLANTITTDSYPAKIINGRSGDLIPGAMLLKLKNNVDGATKMSNNTIRTLANVQANYEALLNQTMHIEVYKSNTDSTSIIAKGDIGKIN